jgi:hypothetical protein
MTRGADADERSAAAPAPSGAPGPTEIRAQIEQTRAEMSQTIDAIHTRLSPRRLVNDAKQSVKDATVGRARRLAETVNCALNNGDNGSVSIERVVDAVKRNPVPFAIAGAAATALLVRTIMHARNGALRDAERLVDESGYAPEERSTHLGGNRRRLFMGACAAGLACWSASRARIGAVTPHSVMPPSM